MATVFDAMSQCNKSIVECYFLNFDAREILEGYNVQYNKDFDPIYIEFYYDCNGKLSYEEFQRYVRTVMAFLECHPHLRADYSNF